LGDAAGVVDPLTRSGIEKAVCAGSTAGQVAVEALKRNNLSESFLSRYQTFWEQPQPI